MGTTSGSPPIPADVLRDIEALKDRLGRAYEDRLEGKLSEPP